MINVLRGRRLPPSSQRRSLAIAGLVLIAIMIFSVLAVFASWLGGGITDVRVTAEVVRGGDALQAGDEVRYRDVVVGAVSATGAVKPDVIELELHITRDQAQMIPAAVTARALPTTIFGAQYVDLVPPASEGGAHISGGARVPADRSPGTAELQTAFVELNRLLLAVHPAKLDAALTAFATALQGQGGNLGQLVDELDTYLKQVAPSTADLQDDITRLANVTEALSKNAPDLIRSLANVIVTSQTIVEKQAALRSLIAGSLTVTDDSTKFLSDNGGRLTTYVLDLRPILGAVDNNTGGITNGAVKFDAWYKSWTTALTAGPFVKIDIILRNVDGSALVAASLAPPGTGKPAADQALAADLNPTPYSAADCPRYPGASGPNCPVTAHATPADAAATPQMGGTVGPVGSAQEQQSVAQLLGLSGTQSNPLPGVSDLLIGPLIRGAVIGVR